MVNAQLDDYWIAISSLGNRLKLFNPDKLKNYLTNHDEDIDFIKFCNEYITELKSEKREKSAANFKTVKNSLVDFFKREKVLASISHKNALMLTKHQGVSIIPIFLFK